MARSRNTNYLLKFQEIAYFVNFEVFENGSLSLRIRKCRGAHHHATGALFTDQFSAVSELLNIFSIPFLLQTFRCDLCLNLEPVHRLQFCNGCFPNSFDACSECFGGWAFKRLALVLFPLALWEGQIANFAYPTSVWVQDLVHAVLQHLAPFLRH